MSNYTMRVPSVTISEVTSFYGIEITRRYQGRISCRFSMLYKPNFCLIGELAWASEPQNSKLKCRHPAGLAVHSRHSLRFLFVRQYRSIS